MTYLRDWQDTNGDSADREVYCGAWCYRDSLDRIPEGGTDRDGFTLDRGGAWPGYECDYTEYCAECGKVAVEGIEEIPA